MRTLLAVWKSASPFAQIAFGVFTTFFGVVLAIVGVDIVGMTIRELIGGRK